MVQRVGKDEQHAHKREGEQPPARGEARLPQQGQPAASTPSVRDAVRERGLPETGIDKIGDAHLLPLALAGAPHDGHHPTHAFGAASVVVLASNPLSPTAADTRNDEPHGKRVFTVSCPSCGVPLVLA